MLIKKLYVLGEMITLMLLLSVATLLQANPVLVAPGCITRDVFGEYADGGLVYRYTLNNGRVSAQVIEYGATLTSLRAPDRLGHVTDVVLGYDTLHGEHRRQGSPRLS